jgi:hypothetical protein
VNASKGVRLPDFAGQEKLLIVLRLRSGRLRAKRTAAEDAKEIGKSFGCQTCMDEESDDYGH